MNPSSCTSFALPPTTDVHYNMHIGCHGNCAVRLSEQLMKSMRAMLVRIIPSHNVRGAQQKDGHQKTIIARGATAGRRPAGVVFLAGLDARHDRFLLPTFATLIPLFHTRLAYARRLCTFGAGKRASRRAPPSFAGLHPLRRIIGGAVQNRVAILNGCGSSTSVDRAGRPTRKAGGRAPRNALAGGLCPHFCTAAGAAGIAGAIPAEWLPQRLRAPARAGSLWRTLARPRLRPIAQIRRLSPRLCAVSPTDLATAPTPLASSLRARKRVCHPRREKRLGAKRNAHL